MHRLKHHLLGCAHPLYIFNEHYKSIHLIGDDTINNNIYIVVIQHSITDIVGVDSVNQCCVRHKMIYLYVLYNDDSKCHLRACQTEHSEHIL